MNLGAHAAGIAGKLTGAVGGAPILTGLVIGGLVLGGLVGGFFGQASTQSTSASVLDIYPCWEAGTPFAKGPPGQQVWITGKNADGTWYRVYTASPTHPEGWVPAKLITIEQQGEVPVVDCAPIQPLLALGSPGESLTPLQHNSPSPSPTPTPTAAPTAAPTVAPTATPTGAPRSTAPPRITPKPPGPTPRPATPPPPPTPPPDTTPPVVGRPSDRPDPIYKVVRPGIVPIPKCPANAPTASTISVTASDRESGVTSVVLNFQTPNGPIAKPMTQGPAGTWKAQLSTVDDPIAPGFVSYTIVAKNGENLSSAPRAGRLGVTACVA